MQTFRSIYTIDNLVVHGIHMVCTIVTHFVPFTLLCPSLSMFTSHRQNTRAATPLHMLQLNTVYLSVTCVVLVMCCGGDKYTPTKILHSASQPLSMKAHTKRLTPPPKSSWIRPYIEDAYVCIQHKPIGGCVFTGGTVQSTEVCFTFVIRKGSHAIHCPATALIPLLCCLSQCHGRVMITHTRGIPFGVSVSGRGGRNTVSLHVQGVYNCCSVPLIRPLSPFENMPPPPPPPPPFPPSSCTG